MSIFVFKCHPFKEHFQVSLKKERVREKGKSLKSEKKVKKKRGREKGKS